jgi:hypothetical protein
VLKKIKKIIISTIFSVPLFGDAAVVHPNFHQNFHQTFEKNTFQCATCTEQSCSMDMPTAGHCVAWCNTEAYASCFGGALKAKEDPSSSFSKMYTKLTESSQRHLTHLLFAAEGRKTLNPFEEHAKTNELLNELQTLHREQQKERTNAYASVMRLVP